MLRVGLTGNLGSGKSTVGKLFARMGAHVLSSDGVGRELMAPGQAVFEQIVTLFGTEVLRADGTLNRPMLARLAFAEGRADDLNAIVHPAVIAKQAEQVAAIAAIYPTGVALLESALIFEIWKLTGEDPRPARFDCILLVTAPESLKLERSAARAGEAKLQAVEEARRRLALQIPEDHAKPLADYVIRNEGTLADLEEQVEHLWPIFLEAAGGAKSLQ